MKTNRAFSIKLCLRIAYGNVHDVLPKEEDNLVYNSN